MSTTAMPPSRSAIEIAAMRRLLAERRRMRWFNAAMVVLGIVLVFGLWQLAVTVFKLPPYVLPAPGRTLSSLWLAVAEPLDSPIGFYVPLWSTLSNAAAGFVIGGLLGILIGSLMAEFQAVRAVVMPYAFALQSLPKIAIAPLIVLWCNFGDGSKVAIAALLAFFPLMVNAYTGIRATDPDQLDLMRSLRASRLQIYVRVKLPSAAPMIFAGLDMAVVYALLGTIVAEFLGAQQGMGVVITRAQSTSDVAGVFAALIVLAATGVLLHVAVRGIERRYIHWSDRQG